MALWVILDFMDFHGFLANFGFHEQEAFMDFHGFFDNFGFHE